MMHRKLSRSCSSNPATNFAPIEQAQMRRFDGTWISGDPQEKKCHGRTYL